MPERPIVEGVDQDELKMFSFQVWTYKQGEMVSAMINLGDRLDLFRHLRALGRADSQTLADAAGCNERFVREWLLGVAAARLIVHHDDSTFELTPVQAAVLADEEESIAFSAGAFRGGFSVETMDALEESFRTGIGITYEQQGPSAAAGLARMTSPWARHGLTTAILPAIEGLVEQLEAGIHVADIGCGGGVLACALARHYTNSTIFGYDPSAHAIELARERAAEEGLDNVTFKLAFAEDVPDEPTFDFIATFDVLHDMPHPDRAIAAVKKSLKPNGVWLVKDIRSSGDWHQDVKNPLLPMFYGFSITSCLQSAMSVKGGMGLGTLGLHPAKAEEMMREAGFGHFQTHDVGDQANLYYEVRH